jgi:hypothetical protein
MKKNAADSAVLPPEIDDLDAAIEDRRIRVQAMKLRRLSARAIAAILNEDLETVQADLEWLKQSHISRYGPVPTIDASQEIGWAVADFEEMESVCWMEFHALKQEAQQRRLSPMFVARARQGWIRTAAMMRVLRIKLLAEHGYLAPQASKLLPGASIPKADDLRALLRSEGLLIEVSDEQKKLAVLNDDPPRDGEAPENEIAGWLNEGGNGLVYDD